MILFLATQAIVEERWEQINACVQIAPPNVANFTERRAMCNHLDGEVSDKETDEIGWCKANGGSCAVINYAETSVVCGKSFKDIPEFYSF